MPKDFGLAASYVWVLASSAEAPRRRGEPRPADGPSDLTADGTRPVYNKRACFLAVVTDAGAATSDACGEAHPGPHFAKRDRSALPFPLDPTLGCGNAVGSELTHRGSEHGGGRR